MTNRDPRFPFNTGEPTSSVRQARALGFYGHHRTAARHRLTRRTARVAAIEHPDKQRAQDWKTAVIRQMPSWMRRAVGRLLGS